MPAPRILLVIATACLVLGLSITAHNHYIEASGTTARLSFREPATREFAFRSHWPGTLFVSLLLTAPRDGRAIAAVDSQGFLQRGFDLRWSVHDDHGSLADGRPADSRMRIGRRLDRALVLGSFRASPGDHYTLEVEIADTCAALDAFAPRIEVGRRPGRPLLAYSVTGHALLIAGAGFLFSFTRRADKTWPYAQILGWWATRRPR